MKQTAEDSDQETTEKSKEPPTCPLCRSPLISEAVEAGKCQCCGHRFEREDLKETKEGKA